MKKLGLLQGLRKPSLRWVVCTLAVIVLDVVMSLHPMRLLSQPWCFLGEVLVTVVAIPLTLMLYDALVGERMFLLWVNGADGRIFPSLVMARLECLTEPPVVIRLARSGIFRKPKLYGLDGWTVIRKPSGRWNELMLVDRSGLGLPFTLKPVVDGMTKKVRWFDIGTPFPRTPVAVVWMSGLMEKMLIDLLHGKMEQGYTAYVQGLLYDSLGEQAQQSNLARHTQEKLKDAESDLVATRERSAKQIAEAIAYLRAAPPNKRVGSARTILSGLMEQLVADPGARKVMLNDVRDRVEAQFEKN